MSPCYSVPLPGGGTALVRTSRQRVPKCDEEGCTGRGEYQCDHPHPMGRCDRYICGAHAVVIGKNVHYCPAHAAAEESTR